jgi:cytochrome c553
VINGAPTRGIASCGSCHGSLDNKAGSPWLEQQPEPYIFGQLQAFASGTRHNDIGQQMRNIARQLTPEEMTEAARYYGRSQ